MGRFIKVFASEGNLNNYNKQLGRLIKGIRSVPNWFPVFLTLAVSLASLRTQCKLHLRVGEPRVVVSVN